MPNHCFNRVSFYSDNEEHIKELYEIFGSGTAVVVLPIHGFGYKGEDFQLPKSEDSIALKLKSKLTSIQYNKTDDPYGWRVKV